ncbi:MAG TPA: B12-binding domain-containing radical SAM protein [Saprospirales bacterium]|nr:B12-binding domain-containing radical SAM protein [Saprospirales bacterium]HAY71856.1 B12-binding domain-containing radical SAM protein [Saprospirales bacterium]HRQ30559.1 radical SAM protein [Saprospiraceae bacterium]
MPKVLYIQPTQYAENGKLCKQRRINLPGLAFPLLAAYTPENWEVELLIEVVDEIDFDREADLVAIGSMGHATFRGLEIAGEFKKRGKTVVMGGYMASIAWEEAVKHVDSIVIGDAEIAWPKLLEDFEKTGKVEPIYKYPIHELKNLPVPRYEMLTKKPIGSMLPVQAGRGCTFLCSFCSIACLYEGKYLFRPVDEVIRDIKAVKKLGFKRFYLIDDNIVSNPKYLKELCEKITPLKMNWASQCALHLAKNKELLEVVRRSGCDLMSFGVESISQEAVNSLDKPWLKVADHEENMRKLSVAGITVSTEMIVGTDYDTEDSIRETFQFIHRNKVPIPRFYILTPIPGTELHKTLIAEGRMLTDDLNLFDGTRCVHIPKRIGPEKLTEMYWWLNNRVFSLKSIIHRVLLNKYLWKNPTMLLFSLGINLHYRHYVRRKVTPNIF